MVFPVFLLMRASSLAMNLFRAGEAILLQASVLILNWHKPVRAALRPFHPSGGDRRFHQKLVLKLSGGIIDVSFRNSQQRQDVLSGFGIGCQIFDEGSDGIVVHLRRTLGDSGFAHNAEVDNIFASWSSFF